MKLLLVLAHPLEDSFTAAIARTARDALVSAGHEVDWLDLYAEGFDPRLTADERQRYFDPSYDASAVAALVSRLLAAEGLVLVFPTWWFDVPAILKGWFDRVFAPGVAFDHRGGGGLAGRLTNIRLLFVLTTTGSPWWIVRLVMGNPVRRLLRRGIGMLCGPGLRFRMISLHDLDRASGDKRRAHLERVRRQLARI